MGLADHEKISTIGLAVYTQHQRVSDRRADETAVSILRSLRSQMNAIKMKNGCQRRTYC